MTLSELFTEGDLTLVGVLLVAVALGALVGAAAGRAERAIDRAKERKAALDEGFQSGIETAWGLIGSDARRVAAVTLGEDRPDLRTLIFDQDESPLQRAMREGLHVTETARALELRGDD